MEISKTKTTFVLKIKKMEEIHSNNLGMTDREHWFFGRLVKITETENISPFDLIGDSERMNLLNKEYELYIINHEQE